jgi:hypothetical protein
MLKAVRQPLAWSLALSLAMFVAGFGIGRGSAASRPPLEPTFSVLVPPTRVGDSRVAAEGTVELPETAGLPTLSREFKPALKASPKPTPNAARERRPRPRSPSTAVHSNPAQAEFSLAEALQRLRRAERAIYSGQAAWALALLDELDARAPRPMLREERIATRVLALCRDGQVDAAERLATAARGEAPESIYGALLERACDTARVPTAPTATPSAQSTTP